MSDRSLPHLSLRVSSTKWEEGLLRGLKKSQLGLNSKEMFKRWWAALQQTCPVSSEAGGLVSRPHIGPCEGLSWGGGGQTGTMPDLTGPKESVFLQGHWTHARLHPHDLITPKAPAPNATTSGFRVSTCGSRGRKTISPSYASQWEDASARSGPFHLPMRMVCLKMTGNSIFHFLNNMLIHYFMYSFH